MASIPRITPQQLADFIATHEFNQVGQSTWFRLKAYGLSYKADGGFFTRRFSSAEVLYIAVGLDSLYKARPVTL